MDWRTLFPAFFPEKNDDGERTVNKTSKVEFADIGCGYGGLLGNHCHCNKLLFFVVYNNNLLL